MSVCPNCHQPVEGGNEFCIYCGMRIPAAGSSSAAPVAPAPVSTIRRCKNGHTFDDADLLFCPVCGIPFGDAPAPARTPVPAHTPAPAPAADTWACACGHSNPADFTFCESCGTRRVHKDRCRPEKPEMVIPEGMHMPTESDLIRRR